VKKTVCQCKPGFFSPSGLPGEVSLCTGDCARRRSVPFNPSNVVARPAIHAQLERRVPLVACSHRTLPSSRPSLCSGCYVMQGTLSRACTACLGFGVRSLARVGFWADPSSPTNPFSACNLDPKYGPACLAGTWNESTSESIVGQCHPVGLRRFCCIKD
jgi:hypothetical protein